MTAESRISAREANARRTSGSALLVCIYGDDKFYSQAHLEGALPMSEFLRMKPDLPKSANVIFY